MESLLIQANKYRDEQNDKEALDLYQQIIASSDANDSEQQEALISCIRIYLENGQQDSLQKIMQQLLKKSLVITKKELLDYVADYQEELRENFGGSYLLKFMAQSYLAQGEVAKAEDNYRNYLTLLIQKKDYVHLPAVLALFTENGWSIKNEWALKMDVYLWQNSVEEIRKEIKQFREQLTVKQCNSDNVKILVAYIKDYYEHFVEISEAIILHRYFTLHDRIKNSSIVVVLKDCVELILKYPFSLYLYTYIADVFLLIDKPGRADYFYNFVRKNIDNKTFEDREFAGKLIEKKSVRKETKPEKLDIPRSNLWDKKETTKIISILGQGHPETESSEGNDLDQERILEKKFQFFLKAKKRKQAYIVLDEIKKLNPKNELIKLYSQLHESNEDTRDKKAVWEKLLQDFPMTPNKEDVLSQKYHLQKIKSYKYNNLQELKDLFYCYKFLGHENVLEQLLSKMHELRVTREDELEIRYLRAEYYIESERYFDALSVAALTVNSNALGPQDKFAFYVVIKRCLEALGEKKRAHAYSVLIDELMNSRAHLERKLDE